MHERRFTGFVPFWFWNDALTADEIRWQLRQMAEQGIHGCFIHSRQGLQQPYLSEAFFEMLDVTLTTADELGLEIHLYDEYPYPSGIAGGEVVLGSPEYAATVLTQRSYRLAGGHVRLALPKGKVLSCVAFPLNGEQVDWAQGVNLLDRVGMVLTTESYRETGLTAYNQKRYFASAPRPVLDAILPEQAYHLSVSVQSELTHFKYWDKSVDVLNPAAIQTFLKLTHERYFQHYGDRFGARIRSIFTDETAPEWSSRIPPAFADAYGYDLQTALPALADARHPDHTRVGYDLYRLKYQMFCEAYEGPVSAWCREHNIAYSGEKPALRLSQLRYMDLPGCEPGHIKVGAQPDMLRGAIRSNARAVASAGYFYGKPGTLCECYHSLGWSATLQDAKYIADGLLLMGISMLVPHGFFYSTHALKKHDAPPTFFFQMPYWPLFHTLSERVAWLQDLFAGTHIAAEILVVEPSSGLPTAQDRETYAAILWRLMERHLDFHIVDTDMLEASRIVNGRAQLADIAAKVVIVPPMQVIEEPLQAWLTTYQAAGGIVLNWVALQSLDRLCETLQEHVQPALRVTIAGAEADRCGFLAEIPGNTRCLEDSTTGVDQQHPGCRALTTPGVLLGAEAREVLVVQRTSAAKTLWFVLYTGSAPAQATFTCDRELRELHFQSDPPGDFCKAGQQYRRTLAPFESFVLTASDSAEMPSELPRLTIPVTGVAALRPRNANLLRMADWRMALVTDPQMADAPVTVTAVPLINQLIQGKFRFTPAYQEYFGHVAELSLPELHVRYAYTFDCRYAGPVQLVMEPGSIVGDWQISINSGNPLCSQDFVPTSMHVRGSLGRDITALLQPGENTILVELTTARVDGGLLNPLYLAGDFGVLLDPVRLVPQKTGGKFERYEENWLPYYAGVIEYTTQFHLESLPDGDEVILELAYEEPFHEAAEVSINGSTFIPVCWQPRGVKLPAHALRIGENQMTTRVYTSLIRAFEGQWFDYRRHVYRAVGAI